MTRTHAADRRLNTRTVDVSTVAAHAIGRVAFVVLVVFHSWLLWTHATLGRLLEPEVAMRWGLAGLLGAGFFALHRLDLPLFKGRRAVVLWTLVILLHCHAVWTGDAAQVQLAVPQDIVNVMPAAAQAAAALTGLLFLAWLVLQYETSHLRPRPTDLPSRLAGVPTPICALPFSPRPPPVR